MTPCYQVVCAKHAGKLQAELNKSTMENGLAVCPFCPPTVIRPIPFKLSNEDYRTYQEERDINRKNPKLAKKMGGYTGPSTKTKALLDDLTQHKLWSDAHPDEPPIKSVVFSTWTTHLDLIQLALENHRFRYVRLDGRMNREARNTSLTTFDHDTSVHIILVSIGAGGLGLNLTKANKCFVMEPQFNPQAEAQAVDRVHRLGQTRPVDIKRFVMEGSFEEKMLELQRKKKALADLTMSRGKGGKEQAARKRLEDLRSLFK
jgi:SNF2 family DNA or RNA helicase